jgi:hypothetical protein
MRAETYKGCKIWGHAIQQQEEVLQPLRFGTSGTVTQNNKFVEASGLIGVFNAEVEAELAGLDWARAYVDNHG